VTSEKRLLTVGSIMHFARDEDVVWGSGVNGAVQPNFHRFSRLDVRAVRGPLTRDFLRGKSIEVPEVFGDPALLLPHVMPELVEFSENKRHDITIVPNFLEIDRFRAYGKDVLDPRDAVKSCLVRIAQSEFVIASSLHAVVIAEALGIPARLLSTDAQPSFKYRDYYMGTGRETTEPAETVEEARRRGGEGPLNWSSAPLLQAFPYDLWGL
jgi:pyruvyltransferase